MAKDEDVVVTPRRQGGARAARRAPKTWSQAKRMLFLDALAATANVRLSAATAGMGAQGAYALRSRDAAFAALWDAALEQGYGSLEAALLSAALGQDSAGQAFPGDDVNAIDPDADRSAAGPIDRGLALQLLTLRRSGGARRTLQKLNYKLVPIDAVETALARQLDIAEKRLCRKLAR